MAFSAFGLGVALTSPFPVETWSGTPPDPDAPDIDLGDDDASPYLALLFEDI